MLLAGAGDWSTLLALDFLPLKDFLIGGFFGNERLRDKLLVRNFETIPEGLGEQVGEMLIESAAQPQYLQARESGQAQVWGRMHVH